jgi:cytoskeletal protein CcmA (bactofilin family)
MRDSERKDLKDRAISERTTPNKITFLGPANEFHGELKGNEDIVIEGKFQGRIEIKNNVLVVERGADVDAEIRAQDITVRGKVKGNIYASRKVTIESEARMTGDISAVSISIKEGAQFKGTLKMISRIQ